MVLEFYGFQQIRDGFLILFDVLNTFFDDKKCIFLGVNFLFVSAATRCPPESTPSNSFLDPAV